MVDQDQVETKLLQLFVHPEHSDSDSNLLESVQTAAAKIILGCLKTTSHEIILKDFGLTPCFSVVNFTFLKPSVPSFLDHVHRSYLRLLQNFLKIFPTTLHASIQTFNYLPVEHIPCIILFFIKAQNSGILYPLIFII